MVFNPLYQYINFAREIILYSRVPALSSWILCALFSLAMLLFGIWIFRKNQDKFIYFI